MALDFDQYQVPSPYGIPIAEFKGGLTVFSEFATEFVRLGMVHMQGDL